MTWWSQINATNTKILTQVSPHALTHKKKTNTSMNKIPMPCLQERHKIANSKWLIMKSSRSFMNDWSKSFMINWWWYWIIYWMDITIELQRPRTKELWNFYLIWPRKVHSMPLDHTDIYFIRNCNCRQNLCSCLGICCTYHILLYRNLLRIPDRSWVCTGLLFQVLLNPLSLLSLKRGGNLSLMGLWQNLGLCSRSKECTLPLSCQIMSW